MVRARVRFGGEGREGGMHDEFLRRTRCDFLGASGVLLPLYRQRVLLGKLMEVGEGGLLYFARRKGRWGVNKFLTI